MTLTELKAHAYDIIAQIEFMQGRLKDVNTEIARMSRQAQQKPEPAEELKKGETQSDGDSNPS